MDGIRGIVPCSSTNDRIYSVSVEYLLHSTHMCTYVLQARQRRHRSRVGRRRAARNP